MSGWCSLVSIQIIWGSTKRRPSATSEILVLRNRDGAWWRVIAKSLVFHGRTILFIAFGLPGYRLPHQDPSPSWGNCKHNTPGPGCKTCYSRRRFKGFKFRYVISWFSGGMIYPSTKSSSRGASAPLCPQMLPSCSQVGTSLQRTRVDQWPQSWHVFTNTQ